MFPGELNLIVAVMSGQGFGGIFASVLNLITLSAFESPVGKVLEALHVSVFVVSVMKFW